MLCYTNTNERSHYEKTIGIICEYNPFHNGHAHQLHTLATKYPDVLRICIMSGSFVQRGEPAFSQI